MKKIIICLLLLKSIAYGQTNVVLMTSDGHSYIGPLSNATNSALTTTGAAPTITLASGAGLGATASAIGNNVSGKITLNTGASLLATGKVMTLTFANSFAYPNGCFINFTPADANFAPFMTKLYAVCSTTGCELYVITTALSIATTYTGFYTITGY